MKIIVSGMMLTMLVKTLHVLALLATVISCPTANAHMVDPLLSFPPSPLLLFLLPMSG
jgi:hypothetical protein